MAAKVRFRLFCKLNFWNFSLNCGSNAAVPLMLLIGYVLITFNWISDGSKRPPLQNSWDSAVEIVDHPRLQDGGRSARVPDPFTPVWKGQKHWRTEANAAGRIWNSLGPVAGWEKKGIDSEKHVFKGLEESGRSAKIDNTPPVVEKLASFYRRLQFQWRLLSHVIHPFLLVSGLFLVNKVVERKARIRSIISMCWPELKTDAQIENKGVGSQSDSFERETIFFSRLGFGYVGARKQTFILVQVWLKSVQASRRYGGLNAKVLVAKSETGPNLELEAVALNHKCLTTASKASSKNMRVCLTPAAAVS